MSRCKPNVALLSPQNDLSSYRVAKTRMSTTHVVYVRNCRSVVNVNKNVAVIKLSTKALQSHENCFEFKSIDVQFLVPDQKH